ncbi:MAG TPA: glycosyltransferase [Alphaproteobacteria bacterium]|nr:glycosyltransferase [Alphaproteobacteria bacterium]
MTARVLFHVQHLLGSGHLRRAAAIASALADAGFEVELVSGGFPVRDLDCGAARLIQLPPARAADESFKTLLGERGAPVDDAWRTARREALLARFEAFAPDVVITELFPLGRRVLSFELVPLLEAAHHRAPRPLILASVRDVLARKDDQRKTAEMIARVHAWYDHVLVHGDPALLPLGASFPEARIAGRVVYTGYVGGPAKPAPPGGEGEGEVIVSVGGGAVGARLLEAAVVARPLSAAGNRPWRLLLGADLPTDARERLQGAADAGCIVEPARRDFPGLLARCHVSVSQAGYNTVMDVLTARARAVLVPFAAANETEQSVRANALARRGWAVVCDEAGLTAPILAAAIDRAAALERPDASALRRDGARETARRVSEWLVRRRA